MRFHRLLALFLLQAQFALALPVLAGSALMDQGIQEFKAGNYSDASGHLGAALASDFNDAKLHYYLGNCYVQMKQKETAIREFRIAFALQPDSEVGRYSKQALALLGVGAESANKASDVTSLFILPPPPKPNLPPAIVAAGGAELAKALASMQNTILVRGLNPPSGGSQHSAQLQAVAEEWRAGQTFDDSKLPAANCDGPWFKIPNWLAGRWTPATEDATQTYFADYPHKIERNAEIGMGQKLKPERWGVVWDRQGSPWEHPCVPEITRAPGGAETSVQVRVKVIPVEAGTGKVTVYYRWLKFILDTKYAIKSTTQCELITTMVPIGTGFCQKTDSLKEFDEQGAPLRMIKYRYPLKQSGQLQGAVTDREGHDFRALFKAYLTENKMMYLMP